MILLMIGLVAIHYRFKMEFSERLKDLRKQIHLTQVELAKRLGIG